MTNREKFKEIWGHNKPEELTSEWWDWNFHDIFSVCCMNCKKYYGKEEIKEQCEKMHCIHDPEKQACIAFERFGRRNVDD